MNYLEKAFYKGLFFIKEVEIVTRERYASMTMTYSPVFFYKYLIKFKNGRLKYVHEDKLIFYDKKLNIQEE